MLGKQHMKYKWTIDGSGVYDDIKGPFVAEPTEVVEFSYFEAMRKLAESQARLISAMHSELMRHGVNFDFQQALLDSSESGDGK